MTTSYAQYIRRKAQQNTGHGFTPSDMPAHLFDFQRDLTEWAIRQGRAAIFADCGMGKTPMELAWADAAPASAPLPCCTSTSAIRATATTMWATRMRV